MDNCTDGDQRLPPDGDEFPTMYQENPYHHHHSTKISMKMNLESCQNSISPIIITTEKKIEIFGYQLKDWCKETPPPLPTTPPPPMKIHLVQQHHKRSLSNKQDDKSEKSVRDKIALFSSHSTPLFPAVNHRKLSKYKSVEDTRDTLKKSNHDNRIQSTYNLSEIKLTRVTSFTEPDKNNHSLINRTNSLKQPNGEEVHRSTLNQLIEQRRKSIPKLRGLVIPEKESVVTNEKSIVDLPEIKSRNSTLLHKDKWDSQSFSVTNPSTTPSCEVIMKTFKMPAPQIHSKYSPAFKRKSLTFYGQQNQILTTAEPPNSLDSIRSPTRSDGSFKFRPRTWHLRTLSRKLHTDYNDCDNDSAVSSTQSSISRGFTPPISPILSYLDTNDHSSPRILKAQSVEAINRKNILSSARCRSGKDFNGSPLIQRKLNNPLSVASQQVKIAYIDTPKLEASNDLKIWVRAKANKLQQQADVLLTVLTTKNRSRSAIHLNENTQQLALDDIENENLNRSLSVSDMQSSSVLNNNYSNNDDNDDDRRHRHHHDHHDSRFLSLDSNKNSRVKPSLERFYTEQYGNISSLASSASSSISPHELAVLLEEASLKESCQPHDVFVVLLNKENPAGSVGITLAGGLDCEVKEITVHRVLIHSIANKDGRVMRGDRILSINGRSTRGLTHKESVAILKQPRLEVILVVSRVRVRELTGTEGSLRSRTTSVETIVEGLETNNNVKPISWRPPSMIAVYKDGAGLGFSLEGGRDNPLGDRPLVIKKIFTGGAAEKTGALRAGDQLLQVNGNDVTCMSRIEAWSLMKKLHDGEVSLLVRHPGGKYS